MTPELQKYYDERFSMMGSQGWADLMEDVDNMQKAANSLNGVDTAEKLHYRRGELSIINWLIGLKEMSEKAYEGLKDDM